MMIFVYWGILILCYFIASRLRSMASRFSFLDKSMMGAVYIWCSSWDFAWASTSR